MATTALIADDSPTIRSLVSFCLKSKGILFAEAASGDDAWVQLQQKPFDLLIVDLNMPGLTGLQLLAKIRQDRRLSKLPVVMVTTETDRGRGLAAGANDYLIKPFKPQELLAAVGKLVSLA